MRSGHRASAPSTRGPRVRTAGTRVDIPEGSRRHRLAPPPSRAPARSKCAAEPPACSSQLRRLCARFHRHTSRGKAANRAPRRSRCRRRARLQRHHVARLKHHRDAHRARRVALVARFLGFSHEDLRLITVTATASAAQACDDTPYSGGAGSDPSPSSSRTGESSRPFGRRVRRRPARAMPG